MLRLLIPFIAGILAAIYFETGPRFLIQLMMIILVWMIFWVIKNPRTANYSNRWFFGLLATIYMTLLGFNSIPLVNQKLDPYNYTNTGYEQLMATVADVPREKERSWKIILNVNTAITGNHSKSVRGKLLTYIAKDSMTRIPGFGDLLIIHARINPVPPPQNPGSFDYKSYLEHNGIYYQAYIKSSDWKLIKANSSFSLKELSLRIRAYSMHVLQSSYLDGKELAIATALLLGVDDILDAETRNEFSNAGVVHILGISGLHVGIIYLVLNFFLRFLDKYKKGAIVKLVLVLLFIWFYALVTGLSPAALRSAAMFSFVSFGKLGKRNVHIMNSLATSALALLLYDPFLICNIGFQFSYIAVVGIVLVHPRIYSIWESRFWLINQAWNLTAMSLAAQLVTFPITLYYFHQFPVYFLPANLLAIPLSNLVIYTGMAVLGTSFIPSLSYLLGAVTSFLIRILGICIHFIENLPWSVVKDIPSELPDVILFYLIIGLVILYTYSRKKRDLFFVLASLLALICWNSYQEISLVNQNKLIIYSVNRHSAYGLISGNKELLLLDPALLADTKLKAQNIYPGNVHLGIKSHKELCINAVSSLAENTFSTLITQQDSVLYLRKSQFCAAILMGHIQGTSASQSVQTDVIIVRNNSCLSLEELRRLFRTNIVILDASNSYKVCRRWEAICTEAGIPVYDIKSSGAFVTEIPITKFKVETALN